MEPRAKHVAACLYAFSQLGAWDSVGPAKHQGLHQKWALADSERVPAVACGPLAPVASRAPLPVPASVPVQGRLPCARIRGPPRTPWHSPCPSKLDRRACRVQ